MNRQTIQYYAFVKVFDSDFYDDLISLANNILDGEFRFYKKTQDDAEILRDGFNGLIIDEAREFFTKDFINKVDELCMCQFVLDEAQYGALYDNNDAAMLKNFEDLYSLKHAASQAA
jgi:hypothetical protein